MKQKKLPQVPENSELKETKAKAPRATQAKKVPTKQEAMSMLLSASNELKQVIQDLKEDQIKLASIPLKKANELLKESIGNIYIIIRYIIFIRIWCRLIKSLG